MIANSFLTIGAEKLLDGKLPFINFDSSLLLEHAAVLPFPYAVFEILENVKPTEDVLAACRQLRKKGYKLALDDVMTEERIEPWLDVVDIVKVDFLGTDPQTLKVLATKCKERKIQTLAEKVETQADHKNAAALGYDYFQGFFFGRPTVVQGRTLSETKLVLIQLLREMSADEVDFDRIEPLMQRNVSLVYKLLRFMNSPLFAWRSPIKSVRHAMALLGEEDLRKWLCLLVVAGLGTDTIPQVLVDSLVRARFAELVSHKTSVEPEEIVRIPTRAALTSRRHLASTNGGDHHRAGLGGRPRRCTPGARQRSESVGPVVRVDSSVRTGGLDQDSRLRRGVKGWYQRCFVCLRQGCRVGGCCCKALTAHFLPYPLTD